MYLPKSLQIASPYVSRWYGKSGRQYEFGVVRSASLRIDEPAVYILAKHEGNMIVPLSVGQTEGGRSGSNGSSPREWEQALAEGMTHAHLRFEARSKAFRQAEVQDLVVALRPLLNALALSEGELIRLSPDRPVEEGVPLDARSEAPAASRQSEPDLRHSWFAAARDWHFWSRARAATPFLAGLLGRVRRSVSAKRGGEGLLSEPAATAQRAGLENNAGSGDDTAIAVVRQYQGERNQQAAAEQPVPERPEPEPPMSEPPEPEPPVSEPAIPDPQPGVRSDWSVARIPATAVVLGLDPTVPMALFADEISAPAGADILVDAVITVGHDERPINVLFVGDGPLKGALEARVCQAGLIQRARFVGDASPESFEQLFAAADFVIIPARVRRNGALAHRAVAAGKPVLVTHQASVDAIVHGRNGLVTYDNPGSLVWGLRELVNCTQFTNSIDPRSEQSVAA